LHYSSSLNPDFSVSKTGSCTYAQTIKHPV